MSVSYPAQYPDIYAYGKSKALQVLPDAIEPTYAAQMASGHLSAGPRSQYRAVPMALARAPKSKYNAGIAESRKKNAPHRRRATYAAGDSGP